MSSSISAFRATIDATLLSFELYKMKRSALQLVGIVRYSSLVASCPASHRDCASAAKRMDARERPPNMSHSAGRSTAVSRFKKWDKKRGRYFLLYENLGGDLLVRNMRGVGSIVGMLNCDAANSALLLQVQERVLVQGLRFRNVGGKQFEIQRIRENSDGCELFRDSLASITGDLARCPRRYGPLRPVTVTGAPEFVVLPLPSWP